MIRKLFFVTMIGLLSIVSLRAQDIVNLRMDAAWQGLRGPVASMDEDILIKKDYFRDDWPSRKWFRSDLRNCLQEDNGRVLTFNNTGRLLTITYTNRGVAGKKTTCSYASNGLLSSFVGEGYKVQAAYRGTDADINIFAETKDYGRAVDVARGDLNNAPYRNSYPFDMKCRQTLTEHGLILTSNYYYVDSVVARTCTYTYNHLQQLVKEVVADYTVDPSDPRILETQYFYDNRELLVRKVVKGVAVNDVFTYVNNEQGDCVQLTVEHPYGNEVFTYEYEYDDYDNWVMRLQFKNGAFLSAALRTLTYHKKGATTADVIALTPESQNELKQQLAEEREAAQLAAKEQKEADKLKREHRKEMDNQAKAAAKAAKASAKNQTDKPEKEKKAKADKPEKEKKAKADKPEKEKKAKADKPAKEKKAKADKPVKEKKAKADKPEKEKKAKADKPAKEKKAKADKPVKEKKAKADKPAKDQQKAEKEMKKKAAAAEKARAKEHKQAVKEQKAVQKASAKQDKKADKGKK